MNDSTQTSWWKRLSGGLEAHILALGGAISRSGDQTQARRRDSVEELEHELIRADLGPEVAERIAAAFGEGRFRQGHHAG